MIESDGKTGSQWQLLHLRLFWQQQEDSIHWNCRLVRVLFNWNISEPWECIFGISGHSGFDHLTQYGLFIRAGTICLSPDSILSWYLVRYYDLLQLLFAFLTLDHGKRMNHSLVGSAYHESCLQKQCTSHVCQSSWVFRSIIAILHIKEKKLFLKYTSATFSCNCSLS